MGRSSLISRIRATIRAALAGVFAPLARPHTRARLVTLASGACLSSGVGILAGRGWAVTTVGVLGIAYGLLLMDVDVDEDGAR